jgi:vWA-MoxR associated protein C-terminal domain
VPAVLLDAAAALDRDLATTLEQHGARCVVLREPPCAAAMDPLRAVVATPTPVIVWWHNDGPPAAIDATMRGLLQSVNVSDLPRRVRDERAAAWRDASGLHPGMRLTLVWDDADYIPPENDPQARAGIETT